MWHLLYVIYGGNYFMSQTRNLWLFGSKANGACHAIPKVSTSMKFLKLEKFNTKNIYITIYNKTIQKHKKIALWAFSKI